MNCRIWGINQSINLPLSSNFSMHHIFQHLDYFIILSLYLEQWILFLKFHKPPNPQEYPKEETSSKNKIWYPRETAELINLKKALCKKCKVPCNSYHLSEHGIQVPINDEILKQMKSVSSELRSEIKPNNYEMLKTRGKDSNLILPL